MTDLKKAMALGAPEGIPGCREGRPMSGPARFVRREVLNLPQSSDASGNLFFLRFRVKRPDAEKAERQFMALRCFHTSFDEEIEFFLDWCREKWPGGRVSCRGMFHGPLRYIAGDGTEVRFGGIVSSPVNGMTEAK